MVNEHIIYLNKKSYFIQRVMENYYRNCLIQKLMCVSCFVVHIKLGRYSTPLMLKCVTVKSRWNLTIFLYNMSRCVQKSSSGKKKKDSGEKFMSNVSFFFPLSLTYLWYLWYLIHSKSVCKFRAWIKNYVWFCMLSWTFLYQETKFLDSIYHFTCMCLKFYLLCIYNFCFFTSFFFFP